jgi:threonine dehydrogenase-like Zn-dependent dehydrogenase
MIAACLRDTRRFELMPAEERRPGPGEVRVRLAGCGVCASDLLLWEGRAWFKYPVEPGSPGHEGWGYVDQLGGAVKGLTPNTAVAILSSHAFAEHATVAADHLVRLPAQLSGRPFPAEPLGCAMNVFARCAIEPGQDVAVVGVGFLGALLIRLASNAGARVVAVSRRPFALSIARRFGASEVVEFERVSHGIAQSISGNAGFARVIEAAGSQQSLDLATALTAERGRLIIAGYHQDGLRQINLQQWNWRGLDVINAHERQPGIYVDGMAKAVKAVCEGRLEPWPLFTHQFPLSQINQAFDTLRNRPDGFIKAMVMM